MIYVRPSTSQKLRLWRSEWWRLFKHLSPHLLPCCIPLIPGVPPVTPGLLPTLWLPHSLALSSGASRVCAGDGGEAAGLGQQRLRSCTSEQNNRKKFRPGEWDIFSQETGSCFPLLRAFPQNTFMKAKWSFNRVLCIPAVMPSAPIGLSCAPPSKASLTHGEGTDRVISFSETLWFTFFPSLLCSFVGRPFYHHLSQQQAALQPQETPPGEVMQPPSASRYLLLAEKVWKGRSFAQAEGWWWSKVTRAGSSGTAEQNVALGGSSKAGKLLGWDCLGLSACPGFDRPWLCQQLILWMGTVLCRVYFQIWTLLERLTQIFLSFYKNQGGAENWFCPT